MKKHIAPHQLAALAQIRIDAQQKMCEISALGKRAEVILGITADDPQVYRDRVSDLLSGDSASKTVKLLGVEVRGARR